VSINQFLATAAAEKVAALLAEEYLETRAKRGCRKKFQAVLAKGTDSAPAPEDAL